MLVGAIFSSILPVYGPAGYAATLGPYTWFIGVIVAGALYFGVSGGKSPLTAGSENALQPLTERPGTVRLRRPCRARVRCDDECGGGDDRRADRSEV